jgi:4-hydroxy-tetrahydrodipicolinate reductase
MLLRMIEVCIAGATGWTGRPLAEAVLSADDLHLRSAVARSAAGSDLGVAWGADTLDVPVFGAVTEALDGVEVLVDYTSHDSVKTNTLAGIERGVHVVIGSSGLTAADFEEIDAAARRSNVGVVAAGNFSLTAAIALASAVLAARYLSQWEVIDYASASKPDVPSGTALEIAERMSEIRSPDIGRAVADVSGPREARGATIAGVQVHSVRVPGFVVSTEIVFGLPDERLVIRHDAGGTAGPYIAGTLLAVRAVPTRKGLTRGLDRLLIDG